MILCHPKRVDNVIKAINATTDSLKQTPVIEKRTI